MMWFGFRMGGLGVLLGSSAGLVERRFSVAAVCPIHNAGMRLNAKEKRATIASWERTDGTVQRTVKEGGETGLHQNKQLEKRDDVADRAYPASGQRRLRPNRHDVQNRDGVG